MFVPAALTSQVLAEVFVQCLMDWNLDRKVSTLTVDIYSSNDYMMNAF